MGFWDEVYQLREEGLVPRVWKRADLRVHLQMPGGSYSVNAISRKPSDESVSLCRDDVGLDVKNGKEPKAWRVGPPRSGQYQLIEDPEDDEATQKEQREKASLRARELRAIDSQEIRESDGPRY